MIDTTVILFSTGMCAFILLRAIRLDSSRPWFGVRKSRRYDGRPEEGRPEEGRPEEWRAEAGDVP